MRSETPGQAGPASSTHDILFRAVDELSLAPDLRAIAAVVKRAARQLTNADGVTVVVREDGEYCRYLDEDAIAPLWKGQRFPMDACISGWVMRRGEPVVIPDILVDPRIPQDAYRPTFVKSLAMMPVQAPEAVAAIGAYWAHPHIATDAEVGVLRRLADNAALALQNLRLHAALDSERRARLDAERALMRHQEAEAALRESESRFRVMADTSPLMIWVTDAQGHLEFVNRAFREFFGVTDQEVRGDSWKSLLNPDDAEGYIRAFTNSLREGTPFFGEARVRRADGQWRWIASYAAPRLSPGGTVVGAVGSSPDITDAREAAAKVREAMRLKDEFIATVAHELRQPLHASVAALSVMQARPNRDAGYRARGVLQRQLQHMSRMVEDLLEASRIVRGAVKLKKVVVPLQRIVRDALDTATPLIEERQHQLEVLVPDEPILLEADATRIQQVLVNLLSNAAKYTPRQGRIRLAVTGNVGTATVCVQDNGPGISADALDRIFEVFTRLESGHQPGFGIGLAVARKLVGLHGGTIQARSSGPDQGSEFIVTLPTVRHSPTA
jgi:PAS domain S-box-containing protein